MAKLRKMLGAADTPECERLMRIIETQSADTLAKWAIAFAKKSYLALCADGRIAQAVAACEEVFAGERAKKDAKPVLRDAQAAARESVDPVTQAAQRAVATACGTLNTPTNALGFVFYGAAAFAYSAAGLEKSHEEYDALAKEEFERAIASLKAVAVENEPHPAKINWNC